MTAVSSIVCIFFVAYITLSLVLRNKKNNDSARAHLAKKVYKISLWVVYGSIVITLISLVLVTVFKEIDFVAWFFEQVVSCIFVAGFLMIPIGKLAAMHILDDKPKDLAKRTFGD